MARVKVGMNGLTVPDQVERARHIKSQIDGNVNYTTPDPTLVVVGSAADALEIAYNESRNRDKDKVAVMKLRRKELLSLINKLGTYVQLTSDSDEEKILSSGFDIRGALTPHPVVAGEVHNVQLNDGSNTGKIKVTWDEADDAIIYLIQTSQNINFAGVVDPVKWATTKTQKEISGLTPGIKYWVRICAIGREEFGPFSEPVSIIVR